MEIVPVGDSALSVRVREEFEDAPEETLNEVLHAFEQLRSAAIPGVIELAPAYTSVAVFFDPLQAAEASEAPGRALDSLEERVRRVMPAAADRGKRRRNKRNIQDSVEIPVCYDLEFGPDLDDVARYARMSAREVINLHSAAKYRGSCAGFFPGFHFF